MKIHGADPISRIQDAIRKSGESDSGTRVEDGRAKTASVQRGHRGSDEVNLSDQAQELRQLKRVLDADPGFRREMVDSLKQEISSGRYRVDGSRVAEGLMQEARILPDAKGLDDGIVG